MCGCYPNSFEKQLSETIIANYGKQIDIATLTQFRWDSLTILGPYSNVNEILPQLNKGLRDRIKSDDDICILVFENSGNIVYTQIFNRDKGDFAYRINYQKLSCKDAKFWVKKDSDGWVYLSWIVEQPNI